MKNIETVVFPDVHEQPERVHAALIRFAHIKRKVFLGDWWDDFGKTDMAEDTTRLVKQLLYEPSMKMLLGNHDASYRWGLSNRGFLCSGWNGPKAVEIHRILGPNDWERFGLATRAGGFLCSHAGFHQRFGYASSRSCKFSAAWILRHYGRAAVGAAEGRVHTILGAGAARGGDQPIGGPLWLDWNEEFEPIPGLNQIVGHTRQMDCLPKHKLGENSVNWCIDTHFAHAAVVDGPHIEIVTL